LGYEMVCKNLPGNWRTDVILRWDSDGNWVVHDQIIVFTKVLGMLVIPVGAQVNGPSIPKLPGIYEEFSGRAWPESIPHDWLYDKLCPINCTREQADEAFHELMDARYPGWKDRILNDAEWAGVRVGGESHFRK
jgi:hypothetical protein